MNNTELDESITTDELSINRATLMNERISGYFCFKIVFNFSHKV